MMPILYLPTILELRGTTSNDIVMLFTYFGVSWISGVCAAGVLIIRKSQDCFISRQYLCQSSLFLCGIIVCAVTTVTEFAGHSVFGKSSEPRTSSFSFHVSACVYGFMFGGYHYSLKMFVFEKVRSKRFPWAWSFLESAQAPVLFISIPLYNFVDWMFGSKCSIYLGASLIFISSGIMFFIDYFKIIGRNRRRKSRQKKDTHKPVDETDNGGDEQIDCVNDEEEEDVVNVERRNSLPDADDDFLPPLTLLTQQRSVTYGDLVDGNNPNMDCISEVRILYHHQQQVLVRCRKKLKT